MSILSADTAKIIAPDLTGSKIPRLILDRRHWLTWTATAAKSNDPTRYNKVPLGANGKKVNAHDTSKHRSFEDVTQAFARAHANILPCESLTLGDLVIPGEDAKKVAGIAIDLPVKPTPITHDPDGVPLFLLGLDWDKVLDGKLIAANAKRDLALLGKTYYEQSPSGTGVRAFALTHEPVHAFNKNGFECYSAGRFLTITGRGKGELQIVDADVIDRIKRQYEPKISMPVVKAVRSSINDDLIKVCAQASNPPLSSLLAVIPACVDEGCTYQTWTKVIWAARAAYGNTPETYEAIKEWSLTSPQDYDENVFNRIWNDRERDDGVTIGTLIHIAKSYGWPKQTESGYAEGVDSGPVGNGLVKPSVWDEPRPLTPTSPGVMPFDIGLLPVQLAPWAQDVAHRMQCPPDFPAVAMVVVLSSLIGARAAIHPKAHDDWLVTANLWGMVVGRPAVMKSPALASAMTPLNRLEADENQRWLAAYAAWETEKKLAELAEENAYREAKKAVGKDLEEARGHLQRLADLPAKAEPLVRRYTVNDSTVEKLGEILQQNEWGLLIYRDELHGLLTSLDKQGQEGARAFYLQAYDGNQGYTFDRIGRGTKRLNRVCFSLLGGIQPGRVQDYIKNAVTGGSGDDGLLQRFSLTVWPDTTSEFQYVDRWPNTPARQAVNAVFDRLKLLEPEGENPKVHRFTPSAQIAFAEWMTDFENQIRDPDLSPALVSHLAKYRKLVPALALIFTLVENGEHDGLVDVPELERALRWVPYLRSHAERLYAATTGQTSAAAARLLQKLQTQAAFLDEDVGLRYITPRRIVAKGWAGLSTVGEATEAAELLAEHGWLMPMSVQPPGGGRPSVRYFLNPKLA